MAARPIWTGSLVFGLVNVPVKAMSAVRPKDIHFHQVHDEDGGRIREKRICEKDGKEVPYQHIAKGYELDNGKVVIVGRDELAELDPEASHALEITEFVELAEVDPLLFDKSYYLVADKGAGRAYGLLATALEESGRVAIASWVMHTKEHLCMVRPLEGHLVVTTLMWADERLPVPESEGGKSKPSDKELKMAMSLIDSMFGKFDAKKFHDTHRKEVMALLEKKARGEAIAAPAEKPAPSKSISLVDALEQSLAKSQGKGAVRAARAPARASRASGRKAAPRHHAGRSRRG